MSHEPHIFVFDTDSVVNFMLNCFIYNSSKGCAPPKAKCEVISQ